MTVPSRKINRGLQYADLSAKFPAAMEHLFEGSRCYVLNLPGIASIKACRIPVGANAAALPQASFHAVQETGLTQSFGNMQRCANESLSRRNETCSPLPLEQMLGS